MQVLGATQTSTAKLLITFVKPGHLTRGSFPPGASLKRSHRSHGFLLPLAAPGGVLAAPGTARGWRLAGDAAARAEDVLGLTPCVRPPGTFSCEKGRKTPNKDLWNRSRNGYLRQTLAKSKGFPFVFPSSPPVQNPREGVKGHEVTLQYFRDVLSTPTSGTSQAKLPFALTIPRVSEPWPPAPAARERARFCGEDPLGITCCQPRVRSESTIKDLGSSVLLKQLAKNTSLLQRKQRRELAHQFTGTYFPQHRKCWWYQQHSEMFL